MNEATQPEPDATPQRSKRTLRLALALRGGVSLAVWIGGATAELDLFRRASLRDANGAHLPIDMFHKPQRERVTAYRQLLDDAGYTTVEIDILAGASAGGLNAVVLGLAQSRGVPLDQIARATWVEKGDIWRLLRTPGWGPVRSIMDGDGPPDGTTSADFGGFFPLARAALTEIVSAPAEPHVAVSNVSVDLAATVVSHGYGDLQTSQPGPDPVAMHQHRAGFTFATRPGGLATSYSTIPQESDGPGGIDEGSPFEAEIDRLALAIRSTSSFPGAFEPAAIYSVDDPDISSIGVKRNSAKCFPLAQSRPTQGEPTPFMVIDGGLFDNIPIDRAVRAIQRAPAAGPTERRLLYLDPSPPTQGPDLPARAADSAWVSILLRAGRLKIRQESAADELDLIHRHNAEILKQRSRAETFAAALRRRRIAVPTDAAYTEARIGPDTELIVTFLRAPWEELCVPPRTSIPLHPISTQQALQVPSAVRNAYGPEDGQINVAGDFQAAIDCVHQLVLWAREIEEDARDTLPVVAPTKARLYRILTVLVEARRRAVCIPLARALDPSPPETFEVKLAAAMMEASNLQPELTITDELHGFLVNETPPNDDAAFYAALAMGFPEPPQGINLATAVWEILDGAVGKLQSASVVPSDARATYWNESVWKLAQDGTLTSAGEPASVAQRLVKVMSAIGLTGTSSIIKFHTIAGDKLPILPQDTSAIRSQLPELVSTTRRADRRAHLASWISTAPRNPVRQEAWKASISTVIEQSDEHVSPQSKLAGARLANFAGFLDWRWRENDWRWGRLDAAAGIVEAVSAGSSAESPGVTAHALQSRILDEERILGDGEPLRLGFSSSDISSTYRYSLAARIGSLAARASWPDAASRWTVAGQLRRGGGLVLRALLVPLILLAQPARLAAVFLTIIAAVAASSLIQHRAEFPQPLTVLPIVCGAVLLTVGLLGVLSARNTRARWRLLRSHLDSRSRFKESYLTWLGDLAESEQDSYPATADQQFASLLATAAGIAMAVSGLAFNPRFGAEAYIALTAIGIAAVLATGVRAKRVPLPGASSTGGDRVFGRVTATLGLVVVALCIATWWRAPADSSELRHLLGALTAGLVTVVLWAVSLWGWTRYMWVAPLTAGVVSAIPAWWMLRELDAPVWLAAALLPAVVWLLLLGLLLGVLPIRTENYGEVPL